MVRNFWLIAFFYLFGFSILFAQNKLQYKLSIGDSLFIKQNAVQDIVQDMNGEKHTMNNSMEGDFFFIVKEKTDSSYVFQFKFTRFKLNTTSNLYGTLLNVDTDVDVAEEDIQGKIFSGITSTSLELEMLYNGKVVDVSYTEVLVEKMIEKANIPNEFTRQLMIESMNKEFGRESLARSMEQMTLIYDNEVVNVGDTWYNSYSGKLKSENLWTLKAIDSVVDLSAKSQIEMLTEEPNLNMHLMGTQDTNAIADKESCMIKEMVVTSKAEGTTIMAHLNNTKIPTTITTKTTYNIKHYVQ